MSSPDTIDVLHRVLTILERSFPQYLLYARPYITPGREDVMPTIEQIVAGADALSERISQQIFESGALPDHGDFPIEFTDTHDLAIGYLIQEARDCLQQDIADLEECVDALRLAPAAQSLASEVLGMVRGHLELLEQLDIEPAALKIRGDAANSND